MEPSSWGDPAMTTNEETASLVTPSTRLQRQGRKRLCRSVSCVLRAGPPAQDRPAAGPHADPHRRHDAIPASFLDELGRLPRIPLTEHSAPARLGPP